MKGTVSGVDRRFSDAVGWFVWLSFSWELTTLLDGAQGATKKTQ